jgi:hypothetical protein
VDALEALERLIAKHADSLAVIRVKVRVGRTDRRVGDPINHTSAEETIGALCELFDTFGPNSYKVVFQNGASEALETMTIAWDAVAPQQPGTQLAPSRELAAAFSPAQSDGMDALIQAIRDQQEHNRAREAALDDRYVKLIELQQRTMEIHGKQVVDLTDALIESVGQVVSAKLEAVEAAAEAVAEQDRGGVIERAIDKGLDAFLMGKSIDAGVPPELAGLMAKNPDLLKALSSPKAREFLGSEHAAEVLKGLLNPDGDTE